MKVQLAELREAFAVVDNVAINPAMESSLFVRMKAGANGVLTLQMTGILQAEARVPVVSDDGTVDAYADRRALKAFLVTAAKDEVEIASSKTGLILRSGQKLEIPAHAPITGYESWTPSYAPKARAGTNTAFDLSDARFSTLRVATKYLPTIAGSESVAAVWFAEGWGVLGTDMICMAAFLDDTCEREMLVPVALAQVITSPVKVVSEESGVGISLSNGTIYQPASADADCYPKDRCKAVVADGLKAKTLLQIDASALLDALKVCEQFLFDGAVALAVSETTQGILLSAEGWASKFQRTVSCEKKSALPAGTRWPTKVLLPWLEHAAGNKIAYAKTEVGSVFRFASGKTRTVFLFADL